MKAKQKAEELVNTYKVANYPKLNKDESKKCALVAVDEIIYQIRWNLAYGYEKQLEYWQEVKQEINNL